MARRKHRFLFATIHRGTIRLTPQQHRLLEARELPHTHWYRSAKGKRYGRRVNT